MAHPLEVQLGLLAVAQPPEEAAQPWTAGRSYLFAEDDNGCKREEQLVAINHVVRWSILGEQGLVLTIS